MLSFLVATGCDKKNDENDEYGRFGWTKPDNFYLYANRRVSICDVGSIAGLGNISQIPTYGFTAATQELLVKQDTDM